MIRAGFLDPDPIIAIGDVFVNGNVTTGNATGNNSNSSLAI
jgi:hypothetical protein